MSRGDRPDEQLSGRDLILARLLAGAQFMLVLDVTIVTVALARVERGLGLGQAELQWIVLAYSLGYGGFVLAGGRAADRFGARRVFRAAIAAFTAASLISGLAWCGPVLLAARAMQGLAAAAMAPAALAIVTMSFPPGPRRAQAVAINASLIAVGFAAGAIAGGALTDLVGWRGVFLATVPAGLAILKFAAIIPADERPGDGSSSLHSGEAILASASSAALVFGLASVGSAPALLVAGALVIAGILAAVLLGHQRHQAQPLIPRELFTTDAGGAIVLALAVATGADGGVVYLTPLYVQHSLGFSPVQAGLLFCAPGAAAVLASRGAGWVLARCSLTAGLLIGLGVEGLGLLTLVLAPVTADVPLLVLGNVLDAVGTLVVIVAATSRLTSVTADGIDGAIAGVVNCVIQLGTAVGIATMATAAATSSPAIGEFAHRIGSAFSASFQRGMAGGLALLALGLGGLVIGVRGSFRRAPTKLEQAR